jgi:uncharacterized protein YidB (DUF937 family)
MGLLDSLLGAAMQNMGGANQPGPQANPLAGALMQLLAGGGAGGMMQPQPQAQAQPGGLAGMLGGLLGGGAQQNAHAGGMMGGGMMGSGMTGGGAMGGMLASGVAMLVQQFAQNGFGQQANSWVGTGANMPIAPQAVTQVFGQDRLAALAQQYGLPMDQLVAGLSQQLPEAVNELTPNGSVPEPSAMEQLLARFTGGGGGAPPRSF